MARAPSRAEGSLGPKPIANYDNFPTRIAPIVRLVDAATALPSARPGLGPSWATDLKFGNVNAGNDVPAQEIVRVSAKTAARIVSTKKSTANG